MDDEVLGVVESVIPGTTKTGKETYRIVVAGVTYSGFGKAPCRRGDEVKFIFTNKEKPRGGFYHNIVGESVIITKASTEPMPEPQPTRATEEEAVAKLDDYVNKLDKITSKEELRFNSKKTALKAAVRAMDKAPMPNSPDIIKLSKELEKYLNGEE